MGNPVLPTIEAALHTDQATVTWVLTAYLLSASVCTPIIGRIGDKVGKDRALVATLVALTLGSLVAALASSMGLLILARVIQGAGGGVLPLTFGIVRDEFPEVKVSGAVSVLASLVAVGAGAGLSLGGPIVSWLGYRWLFLLPMAVTAAAAVAALLVVPPSPSRSPGRISVLSALLLSGWLVALLLGVSQGNHWGWTSGRVVGLFAFAAVLAGTWLIVESRSVSPLVDLRVMRLTPVWTTNGVAFLVGFGMYSLFAFLPLFSQTPRASGYGFGSSVTQSGLLMLPQTATMFLVSLGSAWAMRLLGPKVVVSGSCLIVSGAVAALSVAHDQEWQVIAANAAVGAGIGLVFASLASVVVAAVPPEQTGVASGMNTNIRTIGGSIGAAVTASIVTWHPLPTGFPRESAYTMGFAVLAGVMLTAAACGLAIPRMRAYQLSDQRGGRTEAAVQFPD